MNLKRFIENKLTVQRELVIGKEFYIGEEKVLLLGLQTFIDDSVSYSDGDEDEYVVEEPSTCIYLLYRSEPDDEFDDDDCFEGTTNRKSLMMEIEMASKRKAGITEIESFAVSGKCYVTEGMSNSPLDDGYISGNMIKAAAKQGVFTEEWLDMDSEELWLAEYNIDPDIYEVDWTQQDLDISVEFEKECVAKYVGQTFLCPRNGQEINQVISIKDDIQGKIDIKIIGLKEETLADEKLLLLEYEAPKNFMPQFYSTDFLNDTMCGIAGFCSFGSDQSRPDSRFAFIEFVEDEDDCDKEIELFSYTIVEEEQF